jgi:hypothetical protein
MAKRNKVPNFYQGRQEEEARLGEPTYNLQQRTAEGYGGSSEWDITIPTEITSAPTSNPSRPRALTIGYNAKDRKLIVVFRDNKWWEYNNVPAHMWIGLKNSASTGKFLREEGLDTWDDMGETNPDALSDGVRAQLSQAAEQASRFQNGTLEQVTMNQSFSDEEMYKDYL